MFSFSALFPDKSVITNEGPLIVALIGRRDACAPKIATYLGAPLLLLTMTCSQTEADNLLQGSVQTQNYLPKESAPGLRREDMSGSGDPFSSASQSNPPAVQQMIEPPADAFDLQGLRPPTPPVSRSQPRNLQAEFNQNLGGDFSGMPAKAVPDFQAKTDFGPPTIAPQQGNVEANQADPDNAPELQLAWDQWHRRVANAIYQRFNVMAQMAFKYSRPLAAYVTYVVTREGEITNVQLQQKSPNIAFNTLIILVVKSLSGQRELLQFPEGSRRFSVDKAGMFTQNYGMQGFKYTTGDKETVHTH